MDPEFNGEDFDDPPTYALAMQIERERNKFGDKHLTYYKAETPFVYSKLNSRPNDTRIDIEPGSFEDPPPPYNEQDPLRPSRLQVASGLERPAGPNVIFYQPLADILDSSDTFEFGEDKEIYDKFGNQVLKIAQSAQQWDFEDMQGNILLKLDVQNMVFSSQGRTIGYLCLSDPGNWLLARHSNYLTAFELKRGDNWVHRFLANGKKYGKAMQVPSDPRRIQVTLAPSLDLNTKAMMLACAALMDNYHYSETSWMRMRWWEKIIVVALFVFIGVPVFLVFLILAVIFLVLKAIAGLWRCMPGCTIT